MRVADSKILKEILPKRSADANKYSVGSLLCVVGSRGFAGAAALALSGALRMGAGLVRCALPESIYPIVSTLVPEAVFTLLAENEEGRISKEALGDILKAAEKADAVLIGPGLGIDSDTKVLVQALLETLEIPVLLDADGINCISKHIDIMSKVKCPLVLTPHEGEFSRLTGLSSSFIRENREEVLRSFTAENSSVVLLKGRDTLVSKKGEETFRNPTGNPGMAVAGSGDVLSGMIASLMAQGVSPFEAALLGAYLHGAAGDMAEKELTMYSLLPSDLVIYIPKAIKDLLR